MGTGGTIPAAELKSESVDPWNKHQFLDGLYRFYLEKIITFHTFYLPIAGGVVAYVLAHPSRIMALGLLVPLIVSAGAARIFFAGIKEAKELWSAIVASAKEVNTLATHARMLVRAVCAFFLLHVIIVVGLVAMAILLWVCGQSPGLCKQLWGTQSAFECGDPSPTHVANFFGQVGHSCVVCRLPT
jgi:hypothetical protein